MKTYIVFIEICKLYVNGYNYTACWQKDFTTKKDAQSFIDRIGSGKKGLYSVEAADIEIEVNGKLI